MVIEIDRVDSGRVVGKQEVRSSFPSSSVSVVNGIVAFLCQVFVKSDLTQQSSRVFW